MSNKRAPGRSLDEWMKLVTECRLIIMVRRSRQSGVA